MQDGTRVTGRARTQNDRRRILTTCLTAMVLVGLATTAFAADPVWQNFPADTTASCESIPSVPGGVSAKDMSSCAAQRYASGKVLTATLSQRTEGTGCNRVLLRTWTVVDMCEDTHTKTQRITIRDTTGPELSGVPKTANYVCGEVPGPGRPTAKDNCDQYPRIEFSEKSQLGRGNVMEVITRTWTATDNCGNKTTQKQTINVQRGTPPQFINVPDDVTIEVGDPLPTDAPSVRDGDQLITPPHRDLKSPTRCPGKAEVVRTWTASNECGGTATATQTITIVDTKPPVFSNVPEDMTVECGSVPRAVNPRAKDIGDPRPRVTMDEQTSSSACANGRTVTRTWTALDCAGNKATTKQVITLKDTIRPVLTGVPTNVDLGCSLPPDAPRVRAKDNCDGPNLPVTFNESLNPGTAGTSIMTRTWTAVDACGNKAEATQVLTGLNLAPIDPEVGLSSSHPCFVAPVSSRR